MSYPYSYPEYYYPEYYFSKYYYPEYYFSKSAHIPKKDMFWLLECIWYKTYNEAVFPAKNEIKLFASENDAHKFACQIILDESKSPSNDKYIQIFSNISVLISASKFVEAVEEYRNNINEITFYIKEIQVETP